MRIWLKPERMAQYGLVPSDITAVLGEQNIEAPTGSLGESSQNVFQFTMKMCIRDRDYDPETGAVRGKQTVQGFSDDSSWSRGQAWALYSYTMMFRLTGYQNYLLQAGHIADMLLRRLPADGIPY